MNAARAARGIDVARGDGCWRGQFFAMASPCEVLCEVEDAAEARHLTQLAATEAWRIEDKFSRYVPGNVISRINEAGGSAVSVDTETAQLIDFAATLYEISAGRFDITSGVLRRVWRFDGGGKIPGKAEVAEALQYVGWGKVTWKTPVLRMKKGMEIDFGGIGKEFAVDRAAGLVREASAASCLLNFGGDLVAIRKPVLRDAWKVGIEALESAATDVQKLIDLKVGGLATSGDARRFLMHEGVRYSHILDPRTGWPMRNAPRSITVAADTCTQAGMLSTLAILEGVAAESFLDAQGVRYWANR
ncbi:MAG: FAD:protein FMN transferase [Gammaproteobacteria bacterium]|nr:FAD:protein FMN transferase [Gammaproteobacteria bacterium]